ncbi:MFS general substrate transporter [Rickenella mellea]|uniref:MFS general substrate transporter n=1 Tax=Rickenella mellea TaxID=50990 RepID=A0A4Y7Q0F6_9AGAM|nr:MFS general substrate transporter [Rickenella mellea]
MEAKYSIVTFSENDPEDPKNWTPARKKFVVSILCALSFCAVFGSSSYAPGEVQIRRLYGVNADLSSLGLSLYVLGFAFGPLLSTIIDACIGPLSEMKGRTLPYMISWPLLAAAIAPSAWVENFAVILVFRFLTGCCAACALNKHFSGGGIIADMYGSTPATLAKGVLLASFCPLSGPCFGSLVGFFVAAHSGRGLWVVRMHWFFVLALWPLVLFLPETHGPTILKHRAKQMRKGGKTNAFAAHELHTLTKRQILAGHIGRPTAMLWSEPINQGAAIWISLAYSIIYFFFEAYPAVFITQNKIPFQLGGLPFLGITIGMVITMLMYPASIKISKKIQIPFIDPPTGTPPDSPEALLKVVLLACVLMPVSLFWFAWTSKGTVHWIFPALAGIPFGYSMLCIFYSFSGYTARTYTIYASSAQACNTFTRSLIAAIFPVVAHSIIGNLGTDWGVSLFGFLSLGLIPIPIIFVRYGAVLRKRSRFAQEAEGIVRKMRAEVVNDNMDEKASESDAQDSTSADETDKTSEPNKQTV